VTNKETNNQNKLSNFGNKLRKLTNEERQKGGKIKSLRKTLANRQKALKHGRNAKLPENKILTCKTCPIGYKQFCPTYRLREERKELDLVCLMRGKLLDIIKAFSTGDPNLIKAEKTKLLINAILNFNMISDPEQKGYAYLKVIKIIREEFEQINEVKYDIEHRGSLVSEEDFRKVLEEIREANRIGEEAIRRQRESKGYHIFSKTRR